MSIETDGAPTAASPTAENLEAEGAIAPEGSDANPAASSPADDKDAKEPVDLLSVVQDAVKKPDEAAASSAAEGEGEVRPGEGEAKPEGEVSAEAQAEADAKLPFHEHPRWKAVIAERDGYKEDAGHFRQITGFMEQHGLTGEEVATGYSVMAALKSNDPAKLKEARDYFANGLAQLDGMLGNVLPEDIQAKVDQGLIDEDAGRELAQARASAKLQTERLETRDAADTQAREQAEVRDRAVKSAEAVDAWEATVKATDPDYPKKAALIETTCRAIVQREGKAPANADEAVALAKRAYAEVNEALKSTLTKPKPIRRDPQGSSAPTVHQPKTLLEAVSAAVS